MLYNVSMKIKSFNVEWTKFFEEPEYVNFH